MSLTLYDINGMLYQAIEAAEDKIDPETGEIPDDWYEFLNHIELEFNEKCLNVARYIKNLEADAESIKQEKIKMANRQKALENKAERLRNYLAYNIKIGQKIESSNTVISWRKSESVKILNESLLEDNFFKVEKKPKLTEIKKAFKSNPENYAGIVEIVENDNLQIK